MSANKFFSFVGSSIFLMVLLQATQSIHYTCLQLVVLEDNTACINSIKHIQQKLHCMNIISCA